MRSERQFKVPGSRGQCVGKYQTKPRDELAHIPGVFLHESIGPGGHRPPLQHFYQTKPLRSERPFKVRSRFKVVKFAKRTHSALASIARRAGNSSGFERSDRIRPLKTFLPNEAILPHPCPLLSNGRGSARGTRLENYETNPNLMDRGFRFEMEKIRTPASWRLCEICAICGPS
jgi:hypothetical protein